jgi:hypothetical protein
MVYRKERRGFIYMAEQTTGGRPSSGRADVLRARAAEAGTTLPAAKGLENALGTGNVLGTEYTDTLGAELGYGIDGRTPVKFMGVEYTFAPVSMEDSDDASAALEKLPLPLLALGMVKPLSKLSEISPSDVAAMIRGLTNNKAEVSEYSACQNIMGVVYALTRPQKEAFCEAIWYAVRRWHPDVELSVIRRSVDTANMPYLLRLYFRKNIGALDRFFQRFAELMPSVPDVLPEDLEAETEAETSPEEIAALLHEGIPDEEEDGTPKPETPETPPSES